jgi:hypothetical protein
MVWPLPQAWVERRRRRPQAEALQDAIPVAAPVHGLARRVVEDGPAARLFPATAHRLVQGDQVLRQAALAGDEKVLLAEQHALRIEHTLEVGQPLPILDRGDVERSLCRRHGAAEQHDLLTGLGEADGCIVDFARGAQHRVLELLVELLEARVLDQHRVRQPALVEHVPDQAGPDAEGESARRAAQRRRRDAHRPEQRDRRIEVGDADADERRLRGHLQLRGADVRAPAQQVGRDVDDDVELGLRDHVRAACHLGQRSGRPGQQRAERILRLPHAALERRDRGQRAEVLGPGLLHVELGVVAAPEQPFGDVEVALLQRGALLGNHQSRLERPDRAVEAGHLRGHQHLQVVVLGDAGEVAGVGGFDAAPKAPPEVDLPADASAGAEGHAVAVRRAVANLAEAQHLAGHLLHLRKAGAAGDAELGTRLHDSKPGGAHVRIHPLRFGDQAVENGIVEAAPPGLEPAAANDSRVGGQRLQRAAFPVGEPGNLRSFEVGADRRAGAEQRRDCQGEGADAEPIHLAAGATTNRAECTVVCSLMVWRSCRLPCALPAGYRQRRGSRPASKGNRPPVGRDPGGHPGARVAAPKHYWPKPGEPGHFSHPHSSAESAAMPRTHAPSCVQRHRSPARSRAAVHPGARARATAVEGDLEHRRPEARQRRARHHELHGRARRDDELARDQQRH